MLIMGYQYQLNNIHIHNPYCLRWASDELLVSSSHLLLTADLFLPTASKSFCARPCCLSLRPLPGRPSQKASSFILSLGDVEVTHERAGGGRGVLRERLSWQSSHGFFKSQSHLMLLK